MSSKEDLMIKFKNLIDSGKLTPIVDDWVSFDHLTWNQPTAEDPVMFDRCYYGIWVPHPNDDGLFSNEDILKWYRTFHENQKDSDVEVTDSDLWDCV